MIQTIYRFPQEFGLDSNLYGILQIFLKSEGLVVLDESVVCTPLAR